MINECRYCGKNVSSLKPEQKGQHLMSCKSNPNLEKINKKRIETRSKNQRLKNPIINVKLKCLYCDKEFKILVIKSNYERGDYRKCCSRKCSSQYSHSHLDLTQKKNSKCKKCGQIIKVSILCSDNIYCDECRKSPKKADTSDTAKDIRKRKRKIYKNGVYLCKYCDKEICERPNICKKFTQKNVYELYLGFDLSKKGTVEFYNEFDRIVNNLKKDYYDDELSFTEIGKKYKMNYQTVHMLFKNLGLSARTNSEAVINAIKNGKQIFDNLNPYPYKSGYHINWKGEKIHYRSNYEREYYEILDKDKVNYEIEKLRIIYYDTQKKKRRISIPDIYIKDLNEIIEIKSKWTLDEINMRDKIKAYKKLGYNVKLMIGEGNKNFFKNVEEIRY